MGKYFLYVLFILAACANTYAQQVTDSLPAVKIHGRHKQKTSHDVRINDFTPGQKKVVIDSILLQQYQLQSVSNLLSQQTSVFIKSYGFNGLATLNFRGSSAAQSQVLWNGVPIQNAALGVADVSQLPVLLMNNVNIVYGSSAALLGSGNVGGSLMFENDKPRFDTIDTKKVTVSAGIGSYGQQMTGIKGMFHNNRWFVAATLFGQSSQNNFKYTNTDGVEQRLPNSQLQSVAAMLQLAYKLNATDVVSLYAWHQNYDRRIPPALFETGSVKEQKDASTRLLLEWKRSKAKYEWYAKTSFIKDNTQYSDPAISLQAELPVYQSYTDIGWKHTINSNSKLLLFIPVQLSWTTYNNTNQQQAKVAIAVAYDVKLAHQKLDLAVNMREEAIDNTAVFSPGINASYMLTDWLSLTGNVQHTYRTPNLNELYFFPGGNASLKPEQGWGEELGYQLHFSVAPHISFTQNVSLFSRDIQDWIIWFGGSIWTPHNISEVWSRGLETENKLTWNVGKWNCYLALNTSYILATTQSSYALNDGSIDKQLPYTPRYNGQMNLGFAYKHLRANYNHTYTGYRFMTVDESEYISPYNTGNLQISYDFLVDKYPVSFTSQVNNIWGQQYQVVAFRPMPGTNWLLGFKVTF